MAPSSFSSRGGVLKISGFCDTGEGPAQSAGVRSGWHVSLYESLGKQWPVIRLSSELGPQDSG